MMLKFVGTGSAFNTKLGNNCAYIKRDRCLVIFDCGGTAFDSLLQKGILCDVDKVSVFITHMHPDHVGSLGDIIFYCYYILREKITVHFPHADRMRDFLKLMGVAPELYHIVSGTEGHGVQEMALSVRFIPVEHVPDIPSYGLLIGAGDGRSIYYSGDASSIPLEILSMLRAGRLDRLYQDTCGLDYEGNVHTSLGKLLELVPEDELVTGEGVHAGCRLRELVYCMHLDSAFDRSKVSEARLNIVEKD